MGTVVDGIYFNTESGLSAPGGFLDRLTNTVDQASQSNAQLRGLAPALRDTGVPLPAPSQGIFSRMLGAAGLTSQDPSSVSQSPPGLLSRMFGGTDASSPAMAPPTLPAAPTPSPTASPGAGSPSMSGLMSYVGQAAQQRGIDPMTAIRVAMSEGGASGGYGASGTGDSGSSFSPFQLHYGGVAGGGNSVAGLGDDFTANTGLDARDPANAKAAIDFALDHAAQNGWSAFHGAAKAGLAPFAGINQSPSAGSPPAMAYTGGQPAPSSAGMAPAPPGPQGAQQPGPMPAATASGVVPNGAMSIPNGGGQMPSQASGGPTGPGAPAGAPISGPGGLTLQGGLTAASLGAMIANPATRAQGLALWQGALTRTYNFANGPEGSGVVLREDPRTGTATPVFQAPIKTEQGTTLYDPTTRAPVFQAPPKLEHGPVGRDPNTGQDIYGSINPQTGTGTPFAQPAGTGQGAVDPNLHGADFLKTLPPQLAGPVQAIAEGRFPLPSGQSANSPQAQRIRSAVLQYKPDFDVTDTAARAETRKDFASGTMANTITAGNTALHHLGLLSDAGEALTASQVPLFNAAGQKIESIGGANTAGKQYDASLTAVSEELTKFYRNTGGTESDINQAKALMSADQSPAQRRAGIAQVANLLQGKVTALQSRWHQGMGPGAADYPLIQPDAADSFARIQSRWPASAAGGAPSNAPVGPLPTASPVVAPANAGAMPTITDPAEARKLPSGTKFRTSDGRIGTVP